jgi:hypothetical protein
VKGNFEMLETHGVPASDPASAPAQPPAPVSVRSSASGSSRGTPILLALAGLVAVAGLAFLGGRLTAPAASAATTGYPAGGAGGALGASASFVPGAGLYGAGLGDAAGLSLEGTVESIEGTTLTLRIADGSTVTVDLSGSTTYHQQAAASSSAVTAGSQVQVQVVPTGAGTAPLTGGAPLTSGAPRTFTASDVTLVTR